MRIRDVVGLSLVLIGAVSAACGSKVLAAQSPRPSIGASAQASATPFTTMAAVRIAKADGWVDLAPPGSFG